MLYNNRQELLNILQRENLFTEKKLGQNFLFNSEIIRKIIQAADLTNDDEVLEVGPGLGILTNELIQQAKRVTTVELDDKLIPYLEKTFSQANNLHIVHQNVLDFIPPEAPYKLIANIPYYITSPILSHFLQVKTPSLRPTTIVLLVQLEVAQKICAQTGDHNVLSFQTQIFAKPQIVAKVAPGNFVPAPKVDSAILKLDPLPSPLASNPQLFIQIIKKCFSQKRKTMLNSLNSFRNLSKDQLTPLLEQANISPQDRPQNLTIEQMEKLCQAIFNYTKTE